MEFQEKILLRYTDLVPFAEHYLKKVSKSKFSENPKDMRNKILKKLSKLTTSKKTVQKIAQKRYGKNMFRFIFVCSLESFVSTK